MPVWNSAFIAVPVDVVKLPTKASLGRVSCGSQPGGTVYYGREEHSKNLRQLMVLHPQPGGRKCLVSVFSLLSPCYLVHGDGAAHNRQVFSSQSP